MKIMLAIIGRDCSVAMRQGAQALIALLFFPLVVALLAFGAGPDPALLRALAPGALWVAALLANLLSLDRMFAADHEDGSLDMLRAAPVSGVALAFAKMTAHWLMTGLPLAVLSPLAAALLHAPTRAMPDIALSLLLGTPVISLTGGAIAALMVGARPGGFLAALLLLPLCVPVLIFGAGAAARAMAGQSTAGPLELIAALLALALPLAPLAAAAALEE